VAENAIDPGGKQVPFGEAKQSSKQSEELDLFWGTKETVTVPNAAEMRRRKGTEPDDVAQNLAEAASTVDVEALGE
jgi:hypothetical protein